ncbi:MAG: glycine cleavage system aminomethyltransferase GcvT [Actinobacteria bacterium]|nr:glycine cleavage system aminomethyltransferase GcvT [Actinomycetota bacterium]
MHLHVEGLTRTALYVRHAELGARIMPFAGWAMPLEYQGTLSEHEAVRRDVGVFDVSHLGSIYVVGPGAGDAVAATVTKDVTQLDVGRSQYCLCCDEHGGIVDDLIVYRLESDRYLLIPNAANTAEVGAALIEAASGHGAEVDDRSLQCTILAVQGPRALDVLGTVTGADVASQAWTSVATIDLDREEALLCRTGYTGEVGSELILPNSRALEVFDQLLHHGVTPCGLGARDTLRLEMGYPLHGNDLGPDTDPFEARLSWAVDLERGQFRGRDALKVAYEAGVSRRLLGIRAVERGIPRPGMTVLKDGEDVGTVTSGSYSPTLRTGIGLAYLAHPVAAGDRVTVDIRGKHREFEVLRPPFVDRDPRG